MQDTAQARKTFERAELEKFVEQEGYRRAAARPGATEKVQRGVECGPSSFGRSIADWKRRRRGDRAEKPFRCRRYSFDVDRLDGAPARTVAKLLKKGRAPTAASTDEYWDAGRRGIKCRDDPASQR